MGTPQPWIAPVLLELPPLHSPQRPARPPPVVMPVTVETTTNPKIAGVTRSVGQRTSTPLATDPADTPTTTPDTEPLAPPQPTKTTRNRPLYWLFGSGSILLLSLLVQNTGLFLAEQWQTHPLLGLFFSILTLTLGSIILVLTSQEFTRLRQLRSLTTLRLEAAHLSKCQTFGSAHALVKRISQIYQNRAEIAPCLQKFHNHVDDYLGDREILALFSTHVLTTVDTQAYQAVVRHASAAALITAISPMAWLDALLFLWRTVWMIREIAEIYGAKPSAAGSVLLLRQAVRGMMGAGITDILANSAAHSMGDSVAAAIMARAGQGIANGLFIARIGLQTMNQCRPLPFSAEEKPGLGRIRKELQQTLKKNAPPPEQTLSTL